MNSNLNKLTLNKLNEAISISLWNFGAVKINLQEPFKLVSGNFSPIYINCRQVISQPAFMNLYISATQLLLEDIGLEIDAVAGGETAGIPFAAYAASGMNLQMYYVRKAKKGYGLANLVEGGSMEGKRVLLIEDLITNAGSKIHFIEAIRAAGGTVDNVLVLFDRLQGGFEYLRKENINLYSLSDLDMVIKTASDMEIIPEDELNSVKQYLVNPKEWHEKRGLEFIG